MFRATPGQTPLFGLVNGARGETRTPILLPELDPKSSASTNFATLAQAWIILKNRAANPRPFVQNILLYRGLLKKTTNFLTSPLNILNSMKRQFQKNKYRAGNVKARQTGFRMGQKNKLISQLQIVVMALGLACIHLVTTVQEGAAQTPVQSPGQAPVKTVVIDPGHGGNDTGVKGPAGTSEKDVVLRLARLLKNRLQDRYRVTLTRTDDYVMPGPERTGHANHARADVFISLHAAGSYSPATGGLRIYFYTEPAVKAPEQAGDTEGAATPWRKIQKPHIPASSALAQAVWERTRPLAEPHYSTVHAAPVAVLAGADMPAVLIEAGYLTSPKQEKNLTDNKYLFRLATAIGQGIDDYFKHPDGIAATDLRE